ncbi:hypothetical protein V865_006208 [Kwoniella europaea PYCC6329]|uniref:DUF1279 domain-containing protein n=1 Tax=Kwoniella europaea PYCC6329 TaxID=1423913 RepID=A0AAX4KP09_9TREE
MIPIRTSLRQRSNQLITQYRSPWLLGLAPIRMRSFIAQSKKFYTTSPPRPVSSKSPLIQRYAPSLHNLSVKTGVPLPSMILSFMMLHEITAILPIFLIYWIFSTLGVGLGMVGWIMDVGHQEGSTQAQIQKGEEGEDKSVVRRWIRDWYVEGENRIGKIGKRYGIFGYEKGQKDKDQDGITKEIKVMDDTSGAASKLADAIAAYVVVKALLPLRIAASLGLSPTFARYTLVPLQNIFKRFRR